MDPWRRREFILIDSVAHIERYSIIGQQVEEALHTLTIEAHTCACDRGIVLLNAVLLSVPLKCISGHPWAIIEVLFMLSGLGSHISTVPQHSIERQQRLTVLVVVNLAHVYGVAHLVHCVARP